MLLIGVITTLLGLIGLIYCMVQAYRAKRTGLTGEVIALGEVMDYMGLLGQNDRLPPMVETALDAGLRVEGHIPTLAGLDAYAASKAAVPPRDDPR